MGHANPDVCKPLYSKLKLNFTLHRPEEQVPRVQDGEQAWRPAGGIFGAQHSPGGCFSRAQRVHSSSC